MKLENLNFIRIEQSKFEKELEEETNKYLYHFIVCKMTDGQIIKVDNYNNLDELESNNIDCKFYVEKIHYYKDKDNPHKEYGSAYHIQNIGYFYIGGIVENEKVNTDELKALIADYEAKYKMTSLDKDAEFLNRNL